MKIEGKRVLITGASSGIGLALSHALAEKRAMLALTSRRIDALNEVAKKISSTFPRISIPLVISCDVANQESVNNLIKDCMNHLGGIDILINNAGISVYGDTEKTVLEDFHALMDVNYFGALHCMLEVLPHMKKSSEGLIVNIASVAAIHGVPYLGAYGASKTALVVLSQSLRTELSESGVSILNVFPNYTQTEIFTNEKKVGGAHRPRRSYTPAPKVAKAIVKAIERGKRDLTFSLEGKALSIFQGLLPSLVERAMKRIAIQLRDTQEVYDE